MISTLTVMLGLFWSFRAQCPEKNFTSKSRDSRKKINTEKKNDEQNPKQIQATTRARGYHKETKKHEGKQKKVNPRDPRPATTHKEGSSKAARFKLRLQQHGSCAAQMTSPWTVSRKVHYDSTKAFDFTSGIHPLIINLIRRTWARRLAQQGEKTPTTWRNPPDPEPADLQTIKRPGRFRPPGSSGRPTRVKEDNGVT